MRIADRFGSGTPVISFEFFPPKTDAGFAALFHSIAELKQLAPAFVSVTWGAGGSTRAELVATLDQLEASEIENVLALGGDQPESYEPPAGALRFANELVALIQPRRRFCIGAACYPETHPKAVSAEHDLAMLVQKVRAGAEFLITQLFFDDADYFAFVARARRAGITVPIVPGIMPVVSTASIRRMTTLCGARIPEELGRALDVAGADDERALEIGVEWATSQCRELLRRGAPGLHFYTLNRSPATRRVFEQLSL